MTADDRVTPFFDTLFEGLREDPLDIAEERSALVQQGVDIDAAVSEGLRMIDDYKKRRRVLLARQRLERIRGLVDTWTGATEESLSRIKDDIARALAGGSGEAAYQAFYRKLERVEDADLESLGEDAALLEFILDLESDESE